MENEIDAFSKLKYEFQGIKNVIMGYDASGFISNFLNGLEQGIDCGDKAKIKYFLSQICSWYKRKWSEISDSEYVYDLDEHKRNVLLLKEILDGIDESEIPEYKCEKVLNQSSDPIILLSHSSKDKEYGNALEKLLTSMGIKNDQLIYTSHPLHKIPLDKNIYEYLRESFGRKMFVIVLWSNDYLESPACLNEMGAMWVTRSDYTNIYVPSFNFASPKYYLTAVDKNRMGAVLDGSDTCKASVIELKSKLVEMFGLSIDENQWIYALDKFIEEIKRMANRNN